MKLGSLFSGAGTFELAGALNGIEPVWNSEVEKFCVAVTDKRLPHTKQLGDVTNIHGWEINPVDVITFGSPCQDLSRCGRQAGIYNGSRSSLFFEAVRIIKEMRNATNNRYPRFAVWENVLGSLSSNSGDDFAAVLQSLAEVADPTVSVPRPAGKWEHNGCIMGDGYEIAWKVMDAQWCGVPQRRKRVFLVADFAGESAGEILLEQEGLRGHYPPLPDEIEAASRYVAFGLRSDDSGFGSGIVFDARGNGGGAVSPTLTGDHQNRITDYTAVVVEDKKHVRLFDFQKVGIFGEGNVASTLLERVYKNFNDVVVEDDPVYRVRRLTPTECFRLQGMPDGWTDDVKGSDTSRYRMAGNAIALPCLVDLMARMKHVWDKWREM